MHTPLNSHSWSTSKEYWAHMCPMSMIFWTLSWTFRCYSCFRFTFFWPFYYGTCECHKKYSNKSKIISNLTHTFFLIFFREYHGKIPTNYETVEILLILYAFARWVFESPEKIYDKPFMRVSFSFHSLVLSLSLYCSLSRLRSSHPHDQYVCVYVENISSLV